MSAKNSARSDSNDSSPSYPRKYWWVVLVVLPLAIALIQFKPWQQAIKSADGFSVSGNQFLGPAIVGNVSLVVNEAAKVGATVDPALVELLKSAAAQSRQGDHDAAVARIEQVRATSSTLAKLPSLLNNLGVEYLSAGKPIEARKAFEKALQQDADNKAAWAGLAALGNAPLTPVKVVNSSDEAFSSSASFITDGYPSTVWRSGNSNFPHSFVVELPVQAAVSELSFNNAGDRNAASKEIEISVSTESATSNFRVAAKGVLTAGEIGQPIKLNPPQSARWIKLRILSNYGEPNYTQLGDVTVTGTPQVR